MKGLYFIGKEGNVLVITLVGIISVQEMKDIIDEVSNLTNISKRLWDISQLEQGGHTSADMELVAKYAVNILSDPCVKAIVAPGDLSFGLSRVFEVHRETNNSKIMVFREKAEALRWLESEDLP